MKRVFLLLSILVLLGCSLAQAQPAAPTPLPGFTVNGNGMWSQVVDTHYFRSAAGADSAIIIYYDSTWKFANVIFDDNLVVTGAFIAQSGIATSSGASPGYVRWYEPSGSGGNFFSIAAQAMGGDFTFVWPVDDGAPWSR